MKKIVYCAPIDPPVISNITFYNTASSVTFYVPNISVNRYKTAENWENYARQIVKIKTIKHIVRHLRNSIGHNHFEYDCSLCASKPIDKILFQDFSKNKNMTFQALLKFNDFSRFAIKIANYAIEHR